MTNPAAQASARIEELLKEFKDTWDKRTKDPDSFLTLSEIESLLGKLKADTGTVYSEMLDKYLEDYDKDKITLPAGKQRWRTL